MGYFLSIDKEEQFILILALYVLDQLGNRKPQKVQACRFIKARGLIKTYEDDSDLRATGEEKWLNDFAWAREDAKRRGLLRMPEIGIWQITDYGKAWLVERARHWAEVYEKDPSSKRAFLARCRRVNEMTFTHMILIGRGASVMIRPGVNV